MKPSLKTPEPPAVPEADGSPSPQMQEPDYPTAIYRAARRTAAVAIAFCGCVLLLLMANAVRSRAYDPLTAPRLTALLADLNRNPSDTRLKSEARRMDREIRAAYFRSHAFALDGFYLLLGGVGVFLLAMEVARSTRTELPAPNPSAAQEAVAAALMGRRAVLGLGMAAGGLLLALAVLSRHDAAAEYARAALRPREERPAERTAIASIAPAALPIQPGGSSLPPPTAGPPSSAPGTPLTAPSAPTGGTLAPPADTTNLAPVEASSGSSAATTAPAKPTSSAVPTPTPETTRKGGASSGPATAEAIFPRSWASNWPIFRGPAGSCVTASANAPASWDGASGKGILWKSAIPLPGRNSPIVWNDRVFLTGADKTAREVFCFDAGTGRLIWRKPVPIEPGAPPIEVSQDTGYAPSTMATDGKHACALFVNGDLACFDFVGKLLWIRKLGAPENTYGHASSPILYGSGILIQMDQGSDPQAGKSALLALDIATGKPVWEVKRPVPNSWSTPVLIRAGGQDQIITCANPLVISYDPRSGRELWRAEVLGGEVAPSPTFGNGLVYACNLSSSLAAIRPNGSGNVTKTAVAWTFADNLPDIASPLCAGDLLFLVASEGMVTCVDAKVGKKVWEHNFGTPFHASPVLAGKTVYLIDRKGVMHLFAAARTYKELGQASLGEDVSATPAIREGRLFLRGKEHLYCIGAAR